MCQHEVRARTPSLIFNLMGFRDPISASPVVGPDPHLRHRFDLCFLLQRLCDDAHGVLRRLLFHPRQAWCSSTNRLVPSLLHFGKSSELCSFLRFGWYDEPCICRLSIVQLKYILIFRIQASSACHTRKVPADWAPSPSSGSGATTSRTRCTPSRPFASTNFLACPAGDGIFAPVYLEPSGSLDWVQNASAL